MASPVTTPSSARGLAGGAAQRPSSRAPLKVLAAAVRRPASPSSFESVAPPSPQGARMSVTRVLTLPRLPQLPQLRRTAPGSPREERAQQQQQRQPQQQQQQSGQQRLEASAAAAEAPATQQRPRSLSDALDAASAWWEALPSRHKVLFGSFCSFIICNMDKINLSIAIIPMAQDFGWSPSVSGLVQSSFFWGYILSQLPGGYLSSRYGGRNTLPAGVAMWSAATAAVPLLAGTIPGLCLSRAAVGLGEAIAPSAVTDMAARIVPPHERSTAVSFVFAGLHFGSIAGLLAAPWLIEHAGWPAVFLAFGAAGMVWSAWFEGLMADLKEKDPETAAALSANILALPAAASAAGGGGGQQQQQQPGAAADPHAAPPLTGHIPWRAFLRSRGVRALMYTHFCNSWLHYTMLAWLPTYFVQTLSVDIMHAAQTALLPPLAGIAASAVAGPASDALIARGAPLPLVRKGAQSIAFLVPTACLLAAAAGAEELPPSASVALITAALGVSSFSLAGLYCTHQDLSTKYSSALLGLTNTAGSVPGIVGVAATGLLLDRTGSWGAALFLPAAFFLTTGAAVYALAGSNAPEDYDAPGADAPFAWEAAPARWLRGLRAALPQAPRLPQLPALGRGGGAAAGGAPAGRAVTPAKEE